MAKGHYCPVCGHGMYAKHEEYHPQGTYVLYECRRFTCKHQIKIFEPK